MVFAACDSLAGVVGAGLNRYGQASIPEGLETAQGVAAGREFSLARLSDGSLVGWGYNGDNRATPRQTWREW